MGDTERKTYITTILQQKSPLESIELIKLRLNESRAINSQLIEFFEEYLKLQESYALRLNQVLLKGTKLFTDDTKFNNQLETLGLFEPIWNSLIGEINTELKFVDNKTKTLNLDVLSKLNHFEKKYKGNSENLNNLRRLGYRLQNLAKNNSKQQEFEQLTREWETRVPNFVEIVENYDFNRFILLKDVFLSLQSTNQDTLPDLTKQVEKSLEFVLNFDPNDEITRFAQEVTSKNIQFDQSDLVGAAAAAAAPAVVSSKSPTKAEKHHSFLHSGNRQVSTTSTATNDTLLNNGFTGSKPKEKNKLKSRVGSIFGKKKKDKKLSKHHQPDTIAESPITSNNTSRSSLPLNETPVVSQPSSAAVDRRSSVASSSNDLYQTSRAPTAAPIEIEQPTLNQRLSVSSQPLTPSPAKNTPPVTNSTATEYFTANSGTAISEQQHIPPPVPVARGTFNGSTTAPPVSIHDRPHGSVPPPPPTRQRRDIQSSLFVGLDPTKDPAALPPTYQSQEPLGRQITGGSLQRQSTGALLPAASFNHPDLVYPGLNSSVAEVVNATYKDNQLIKGNVVSELALSYIVGSEIAKLPSSIKLQFPLATSLGKLLVNNQFIRQDSETDFEIIDVSAIHLKTVGAIKYTVPITKSVVSVLPVWRFEPHQTSVVISVKLSPEILDFLPLDASIVLNNFIVSVSIIGAHATSAATRPTGSFNKDKARVTWVYSGPVTLSHDKEERIIARFATDGTARESEHGVQIKFTVNNEDGAPLVTTPIELHSKNVYGIDPFNSNTDVSKDEEELEDDNWKLVPTVKTLIAGKYEGHS